MFFSWKNESYSEEDKIERFPVSNTETSGNTKNFE